MGLVRLFKNRISVADEDRNLVFLEARVYPLARVVEGLGWLVYVNNDFKKPLTSIIRFDEGEEVE